MSRFEDVGALFSVRHMNRVRAGRAQHRAFTRAFDTLCYAPAYSSLARTPASLPQRLVVENEAVLHGVAGCRIGASSLRKGAFLRAASANNARKAVVSLDAARLGVKSVVLVALPGELLPDSPRLRPYR